MTLLGYILDEDDFEVVPTINRTVMFTEIEEPNQRKDIITYRPFIRNNHVDYSFVFNENSDLQLEFTSNFNTTFTRFGNIFNITRIIINVNNVNVLDGLSINSPITFTYGDIINITVEKEDNSLAKFVIIGVL
jgi:hypothetical protein